MGDFYSASSICVSLAGMENLEWAFDFWLIYFVPKLPLLTVWKIVLLSLNLGDVP